MSTPFWFDDIYILFDKNYLSYDKSDTDKNKFKTIISADTAGSAKDLSTGNDKSIAAIASKLSAKIYNLKILNSDIQDNKENFTRFLLMGKNVIEPDFKEEKYITSLLFKLKSKLLFNSFPYIINLFSCFFNFFILLLY